ncbi:GNAT family N-acetyltransferase [Paenibacillus bovis]|uniref:GNAT family N-acetyltransferase n=1 Tax=Paenibacillus bovis TaxID=1616788 RepID=A0A172ZIW6_9BACL|nr:GNAT family N-acetyltransferase [Paenibacillus bovis]ANF97479.1 GNAT family N-acetyltransferase [Paenibacillus bovis]
MIQQMDNANKHDYNRSNEGFTVIGRLIPQYENDCWSYTEELYDKPYPKEYEDENIDDSYINNTHKAVFFYYSDHHCVGQIRLRVSWNGYAFIEDLGICQSWRQKGIGSLLLDQAIEWARQNKLIGLALETQDVNLSACRFYARKGFVIGGIDTMLYSKFSTAHEKAIFWYYML